MNKILLLAFLLLPIGCNKSGLSAYAKAMSFCVTMVRHFEDYEKEVGEKPSGIDLKVYLKKNGIDEHLMKNWVFGNSGDDYVAYNVNVETRSGSLVTIILYKNGKYDTLGLKK